MSPRDAPPHRKASSACSNWPDSGSSDGLAVPDAAGQMSFGLRVRADQFLGPQGAGDQSSFPEHARQIAQADDAAPSERLLPQLVGKPPRLLDDRVVVALQVKQRERRSVETGGSLASGLRSSTTVAYTPSLNASGQKTFPPDVFGVLWPACAD